MLLFLCGTNEYLFFVHVPIPSRCPSLPDSLAGRRGNRGGLLAPHHDSEAPHEPEHQHNRQDHRWAIRRPGHSKELPVSIV